MATVVKPSAIPACIYNGKKLNKKIKQIQCESGTKHLVTYFIFYFYRESQIELRQQIDLVAEGNIHTVICQNYSVTSNFPYIYWREKEMQGQHFRWFNIIYLNVFLNINM